MPPDSPPRTGRLDSIDTMRGLVMVLMALDHARDYFGNLPLFELNALQWKSADVFFTRFVSHFCAPTFVLLAGTGAFLAGTRGKTRGQLAWFLATRGLWLIVLEHTLVHVSWFAQWNPGVLVAGVIWAIGCSMVILAALIWLPARAIGLLGVVIIGMHNLLDGLPLSDWGPFCQAADFCCNFVVVPYAQVGSGTVDGLFTFQGLQPQTKWIFVHAYPFIPWFGVMALGYGLGPLFLEDESERRRRLLAIGLLFTVAFVVLRAWNIYGDPRPWQMHADPMKSLQDLLHCEKYPPSLSYVLMTVGPMLMLLAFLPDRAPRWLGPVVTFGRVPLFFYLLHLVVLHLGAAAVTYLMTGVVTFQYVPAPAGPHLNLAGVYIAWLTALFVLYWPCRWYAGVKKRHPGGILSYL